MRAPLLVTLSALGCASAALAQIRPSWSATARLTETSVGPSDPALWFGGRLDWSQPGASFEASAAGGRGWRGRLGGEVSAVGQLFRELGHQLDLQAALRGAIEHPIGRATVGELSGRLGIGRRVGPVVVKGGGLLLGQARSTSAMFAGGFLSTAIALGPVTLTGDIGQLATLSGSLASTSLGNIPTDTQTGDTRAAGGGTGTTARRLSHALVGARMSHGMFEVYTNLLRRSRLELGDSFGWEAGLAIGPIAGARLRVSGGRMPAPQTIYLPYRQQLALGVELVGRPPRGPAAERPQGGIGFDVLVGSATEPVQLVIRHPTASRVEVAGDFSNWEPVSLRAVSPGVFETAIHLAAGTNQINVRFDGGRWEVPPGLGSAPDEFGGRAGILIR